MDWLSKLFAGFLVERLFAWLIALPIVAVIIGIFEYLATCNPGIAIVVSLVALILFVILIYYLAKWRKLKRSSDNDCAGLEFFESRSILDQKRPLKKVLPKASNEFHIQVSGRKFFAEKWPDEYLNRIKKVIFPHPDSPSIAFFAESTNEDADSIKSNIRKGTAEAKNKGIEVKWSKELIQYSIRLGDPMENSGWVHIEHVIPFSYVNQRTSMTLYRKDFEEVVRSYYEIFDRLWELSVDPVEGVSAGNFGGENDGGGGSKDEEEMLVSLSTVTREVFDLHKDPDSDYSLDFIDMLEGFNSVGDTRYIENINDHIASAIADYVDIFGIRNYGEQYNIITDMTKLKESQKYMFADGGNNIYRKDTSVSPNVKLIEWRNLKIRENDKAKAIEDIKGFVL